MSLPSVIMYAVSAIICLVYVVVLGIRSRFREKRVQQLYMACLTCLFALRVGMFANYNTVSSPRTIFYNSFCFVFLTAAKLLALSLWYECGLALTASMNARFRVNISTASTTAKTKFRHLLVGYFVFYCVVMTALSVWMGFEKRGASFDLVDPEFMDFYLNHDLFHGSVAAFGIFPILNGVCLGVGCVVLGVQLWRKAQLYESRFSSDVQKLKRLSVGAVVICISFFVRAILNIVWFVNTDAAKHCTLNQDTAGKCEAAFLFVVEWLPSFYFATLLFVSIFRRGNSNRMRKISISNRMELSMSTPLVEMSSDGKNIESGGSGGGS